MSVLILQGPHTGDAPVPLPANWAGHDLHTVRYRDIGALVAGLRAVRAGDDVAMVLLESGDLRRPECRAAWPALRSALDQLPVPYIELHADAGEALEPWLHPNHAPLATLITPRDRQRGYAMSQAITVRRLGAGHAQ